MKLTLNSAYWVFCFIFVFDYRSAAEGGSLFHIIAIILATLTGGLILYEGRMRLFSRPVGYWVLAWWFLIAWACFISLAEGIPFGDFIRSLLGMYLCGLGMLVALCLANFGFTPSQLLTPLIFQACVNVVWRFVHALIYKGVTLETVRVEILSPCLPLMLAYAACGLLLGDRPRPSQFAVALMALGIIVVSITRTFFIIGFMIGLAVLAGLVVGVVYGSLSRSQLAAKSLQLIVVGAMGSAAIATFLAVNPMIYERWVDRLFFHGGNQTKEDITAITRKAEALGIYETMRESPARFVTGAGLGATLYWHPIYTPDLLHVYGSEHRDELLDIEATYPGHSTWTFAYYTMGILGISIFVIIHLGGGGLALYAAIVNAKVGPYPLWQAIVPLAILASAIGQSLTDNPFRERVGGLVVGIGFGMIQALINGPFYGRGRMSRYIATWQQD